MPERILYPEFRNELEFTRYPFGDNATLVSNDGQTLEEDTFLDASLHPIGGGAGMHIASITVTARKVTITVGDSGTPDLCSVEFDPLSPPDLLRLTDAYGRPAGVLVSESLRLARFSAWENQVHAFGRDAAEFAASCVIPTPEVGVRGILTEEGDLLTGDVWIIGENGVVVREDGDCNIRVDIVGDPLFLRKLCFPVELFEPPLFIQTINGCPPDDQGNWNLTVGDHTAPNGETIIRINPTDGGLKIEAVGQLVRQG